MKLSARSPWSLCLILPLCLFISGCTADNQTAAPNVNDRADGAVNNPTSLKGTWVAFKKTRPDGSVTHQFGDLGQLEFMDDGKVLIGGSMSSNYKVIDDHRLSINYLVDLVMSYRVEGQTLVLDEGSEGIIVFAHPGSRELAAPVPSAQSNQPVSDVLSKAASLMGASFEAAANKLGPPIQTWGGGNNDGLNTYWLYLPLSDDTTKQKYKKSHFDGMSSGADAEIELRLTFDYTKHLTTVNLIYPAFEGPPAVAGPSDSDIPMCRRNYMTFGEALSAIGKSGQKPDVAFYPGQSDPSTALAKQQPPEFWEMAGTGAYRLPGTVVGIYSLSGGHIAELNALAKRESIIRNSQQLDPSSGQYKTSEAASLPMADLLSLPISSVSLATMKSPASGTKIQIKPPDGVTPIEIR